MNDDDYSAQFDKLTTRQRDCMREVSKGYMTKEIARRLGMSPGNVNKHVFAVRQRLGGISRFEAARLFTEWEGRTAENHGVYSLSPHPVPLSEHRDSGSIGLADDHAEGPATQESVETELAEEQRPYLFRKPRFSFLNLLPLRLDGRRANDLNTLNTMIVIAILIAVLLVSAGSAVSLLFAFNRLTR